MRLRAMTLLVVSFVCSTHAFGQDSENLKNKILAYLDFSSIADRVRSAGVKARNPTNVQNSLPAPTRQQYLSLYQALTKLQSTRAGYLTTMKLYVDSVKNHLPSEDQQKRRKAFEDQIESLRQDLVCVSSRKADGPIPKGH